MISASPFVSVKLYNPGPSRIPVVQYFVVTQNPNPCTAEVAAAGPQFTSRQVRGSLHVAEQLSAAPLSTTCHSDKSIADTGPRQTRRRLSSQLTPPPTLFLFATGKQRASPRCPHSNDGAGLRRRQPEHAQGVLGLRQRQHQ